MRKSLKAFIIVLVLLVIFGLFFLLARGGTLAVLSPQGPIGQREKELIIFGSLLALIIVIPVFALTAGIVWKYRASNTKSRYTPDWDRNRTIEAIWWLVPSALILTLSIVTWTSSHELDPYRPIASDAKPLTIQVVALDWKWLFIYPAENVASVNFIQVPTSTPINFVLTSDAPMNSFWIPQLGGQIYAMPGMSSQLHLLASTAGDYRGVSANISGAGFAGMNFTARAGSMADFDSWVARAKSSSTALDLPGYEALARPSSNNTVKLYSAAAPGLYDDVIMKYMSPTGPLSQSSSSAGTGTSQ